MASAGAYNTVTARPLITGGADATAGTQAARAVALEAVRSGDQIAIQEAAALLVATGDLVPAIGYDDFDENGEEASHEESPEIGMEEEDSAVLEGWDPEKGEVPTASLRADGSDWNVGAGNKTRPWRLIVEDGVCRFECPEWWKWNGKSKFGRDWVNDNERRFLLLDGIAEWLTKERKEFLTDPDPWHLGCSALAELKAGWASVSQTDFVANTKLQQLAGASLFSRNVKESDLVLEGGALPLDFLFGPDARMAWVANAVKGMAAEAGRKMVDVLQDYKDVTVPKGQAKKFQNDLLEDLDFRRTISKANAMVGTKWAGVLKRFKTQVLG